jgi:hypothetical protein
MIKLLFLDYTSLPLAGEIIAVSEFVEWHITVCSYPKVAISEYFTVQPSRNFDGSTKLYLTTEPPLLGRCCYKPFFFPSLVIK